jgi:hypothetical protein
MYRFDWLIDWLVGVYANARSISAISNHLLDKA